MASLQLSGDFQRHRMYQWGNSRHQGTKTNSVDDMIFTPSCWPTPGFECDVAGLGDMWWQHDQPEVNQRDQPKVTVVMNPSDGSPSLDKPLAVTKWLAGVPGTASLSNIAEANVYRRKARDLVRDAIQCKSSCWTTIENHSIPAHQRVLAICSSGVRPFLIKVRGHGKRNRCEKVKGDSHQIWIIQIIQITVASLSLFLRSSTGPNRPFQPQSLGRVRDPVRIAEGPSHAQYIRR